MDVIIDLDVPYHQQDDCTTCGDACQQMLLHSLGIHLADCDQVNMKKTDTANREKDHPEYDDWGDGADPPSMADTMNMDEPVLDAAFGINFVTRAFKSEPEVTFDIIETITLLSIAPIVLVWGGAHWVIVRGYHLVIDPADSTTFTVLGFHVNDPAPSYLPYPEEETDPIRHCDSEDSCGAPDNCGGGVIGGDDYGIADEYVSHHCWTHTYMTAVLPSDPATPVDNMFVAVRAEPSPPLRPPDTIPPGSPGFYPGGIPEYRVARRELVKKYAPQEQTSTQQVTDVALNGLIEHRLGELSPVWQQAIDRHIPGTPVLVNRIDHPGDQYYLVPYSTADDKTSVLVLVDGPPARFCRAAAINRIADNPLFSIDAIRQQLIGSQYVIDLQDDHGPVELNGNNYKGLFWQPCMESFSPYHPFFKFVLNNQGVFVPLDALLRLSSDTTSITRFYTNLHTNVRGM